MATSTSTSTSPSTAPPISLQMQLFGVWSPEYGASSKFQPLVENAITPCAFSHERKLATVGPIASLGHTRQAWKVTFRRAKLPKKGFRTSLARCPAERGGVLGAASPQNTSEPPCRAAWPERQRDIGAFLGARSRAVRRETRVLPRYHRRWAPGRTPALQHSMI